MLEERSPECISGSTFQSLSGAPANAPRKAQDDLAVPGRLSTVCMRQVIEYIHAHLHQPLTLTRLAGVAALSPHHFARVFKQTTSVSPHQYILQTRIEHIKTLLLKEDLPLATIATELGFVDQSQVAHSGKG